jgi:hypothetical protein
MRILAFRAVLIDLRLMWRDEPGRGAWTRSRRTPRFLEDGVRCPSVLRDARGGGAGTTPALAVVLALAIEGSRARGTRSSGAGSLLRTPAQHGGVFAGRALTQDGGGPSSRLGGPRSGTKLSPLEMVANRLATVAPLSSRFRLPHMRHQ